MTGSVRKRGNTWTAYWFTTDPVTGKRRQHSKGGFRIKRDAEDYLSSILGRVAEGRWTPDKTLTVKQLLVDQWLPAQEDSLRPATIAQYKNVVDHWLVPHLGGVKVTALTVADIKRTTTILQTTKSARGRDGLSPRSVQLTVGVLKAASAWAVKAGLISHDPMSGVRRPSAKSHAARSWTEEEAQKFLKATADDRFAAAWALLLTRGLRRGELCGLRWSAVDLTAGTLEVSSTRIVVNGKAIESDVKTSAARRMVPIDPTLAARLKALQKRQIEERLLAGPAYEDSGFVFSDELGRPYHPDTVSDRFGDLRAKLKLPQIRLHDLRHTAASLMLASGVPVKVVQEMLGHSSPQITFAIYAHVMPGMAEAAGAALSDRLLADQVG